MYAQSSQLADYIYNTCSIIISKIAIRAFQKLLSAPKIRGRGGVVRIIQSLMMAVAFVLFVSHLLQPLLLLLLQLQLLVPPRDPDAADVPPHLRAGVANLP